jgi:gliding motility-associated lipoprotein GldK
MRKISLNVLAIATVVAATGCGSSGPQGQLVGASNGINYAAPVPLGMVYVPSGVMIIGNSDQDVRAAFDAENRTLQMTGFYMDATEITNAEYRQFTNYVRDSIAHTALGDFKDDDMGNQRIDWKKQIKWKDQDVIDQLEPVLYVAASQNMYGVRITDASKMVYHYDEINYDKAVATPGLAKDQYLNSRNIRIYPDTTVWVRQFAYSYNDPMAAQYYWSPAYDRYPVVGVNYYQSEAFCDWRTKTWRDYRSERKMPLEQTAVFRLPNEEQWEWAARGGRQGSPYPWGGPYVINKKGCYLANFKPNKGSYSADGGLYTVRADAYWPNDYGLYNMAGNVAEWTSSPYANNAYGIVSDINPNIRQDIKESDPQWLKRKVVRGGSWKDVSYYLMNSTRDYEYADTAKAYIGFRSVITFLQPSMNNRPARK